MKCIDLTQFEKSFGMLSSEVAKKIFIVYSGDELERSYIAADFAAKTGLLVEKLVSEALVKEFLEPSFFGQKKAYICDEPVNIKPEIPQDSCIFFTAKKATPLLRDLESKCLVLDLNNEQPWKRQARLKSMLINICQASGKTLTAQSADFLVFGNFIYFSALFSEIQKIITYCAEKKTILPEDISAVVTDLYDMDQWKLVDKIIFGSKEDITIPDLHSFVGMVRYSLKLGLSIVYGAEVGYTSSRKAQKFKKSGLNAQFFKKGLIELFDLEHKLRSGISNHNLLLSRFRAKLEFNR